MPVRDRSAWSGRCRGAARRGFIWVVEAAFARGERTFSPGGARRLLPESPLSSHEQRNVRVLT